MESSDWMEEFGAAITVCDAAGVVLSMNRAAGEVFAKDGSRAYIGKNILDCHPEPARSMLAGMLKDFPKDPPTIPHTARAHGGVKDTWNTEQGFKMPPEMPKDIDRLSVAQIAKEQGIQVVLFIEHRIPETQNSPELGQVMESRKVIYADPSADITEQVLKRMNDDYKAAPK